MRKKRELYTVPFSETVKTDDGEHGFIGLFVEAHSKSEAKFYAKRRLEELREDPDVGLYNPPRPKEDTDIDKLINKSQIHLATPTEIQCSNFADTRAVDHKNHRGNYVEYHYFHWDLPESFFDKDEQEGLEEKRSL